MDCPIEHLRKTILHPDVQARDCTRIEVSLYACCGSKLSNTTAERLVGQTPALVSSKNPGLFVVQPSSQQWKNLASDLHRCLVLANRPTGQIFVARYTHTKTGRVAGVHVVPTTQMVDDDKWERTLEWAASDFGFRQCPLFRIDILAIDKNNIQIAPLHCYTKEANAQMILAARKKPQIHLNGLDPSLLLLETPYVSWTWCKKKSDAIGTNKSILGLHPTHTDRRLQKVEDALVSTEWRQKIQKLHKHYLQKQKLVIEHHKRKEELEKLQKYVDEQAQQKENSRKVQELV